MKLFLPFVLLIVLSACRKDPVIPEPQPPVVTNDPPDQDIPPFYDPCNQSQYYQVPAYELICDTVMNWGDVLPMSLVVNNKNVIALPEQQDSILHLFPLVYKSICDPLIQGEDTIHFNYNPSGMGINYLEVHYDYDSSYVHQIMVN